MPVLMSVVYTFYIERAYRRPFKTERRQARGRKKNVVVVEGLSRTIGESSVRGHWKGAA